MLRPWEADFDLTDAAAARLIERQFPSLSPAHLKPLGVGWDNTAYLVNGRIVFRFPRRAMSGQLARLEARVLPLLAPHLALPIPNPRFVGSPADGYPYGFVGYELIQGVSACELAWTETERAGLAAPLGRFVAALHGIPVSDAVRSWAPVDTLHRTDMRGRLERLRGRIVAMHLPEAVCVADVLGQMDELAAAASYGGPDRWVHGDLYACHLLIDDSRDLAGVIDWGDVHLGDPALDLSVA